MIWRPAPNNCHQLGVFSFKRVSLTLLYYWLSPLTRYPVEVEQFLNTLEDKQAFIRDAVEQE